MGTLVNAIPNPLEAISLYQNVAGTLTGVQNAFIDPEEERRKQLRADQDLQLQQLQAQQRLQQAQSLQDTELQRQEIALQSQQDEEERQASLRRAVSRQNARFGASGVSTGGGSSQAVLLGLFEESEEEKARREELDTLRFTALDQDLGQQQSLNVLQRTQLQERQNIQRLF